MRSSAHIPGKVGRIALQLVEFADRQVVEEAAAEETPERCGMVARHSRILVQVECRHAPPVDAGLRSKRGVRLILRRSGGEHDRGGALRLHEVRYRTGSRIRGSLPERCPVP